MPEEKKKNELTQKEFRFIKTIIIINKGRQLLFILRLYISVALQQKTGNFKAVIRSREKQWGALPEEKQKDELAA